MPRGIREVVAITGTGGRENEIDYAPSEHHGWYAVHDSASGDIPEPIVLHDASGCRDFRADTAAVVGTIRRFLAAARPIPWKDRTHVPGDH
ncbi:hypothetical protein [Streptomyces sp. NPDC001450]